MSPRAFLEDLFAKAVAAAHPSTCLPRYLPPPPRDGPADPARRRQGRGLDDRGRGAHYLDAGFPAEPPDRHRGRAARLRPADARDPDDRGRASGARMQAGLESAAQRARARRGRGRDDLVLVLMSGGASANWIAPARASRFAEKQAVTRALLRSGANIGEINTVRKHLSRIKGGRLARAALSGARRHARDLRRAGRRSRGDRLGADRARSIDARRRARDRCALQARSARCRDRGRSNDPDERNPEAGRRRFRAGPNTI